MLKPSPFSLSALSCPFLLPVLFSAYTPFDSLLQLENSYFSTKHHETIPLWRVSQVSLADYSFSGLPITFCFIVALITAKCDLIFMCLCFTCYTVSSLISKVGSNSFLSPSRVWHIIGAQGMILE